MKCLRLLLILCLLIPMIPGEASAADGRWIEVTGHAAINGSADRDSARRRALADALFQAALAGGADVRGHTAVSKSVVTSDLTIVRAIGRVNDHRVVAQSEKGGLWTVTIQALVGIGGDPFCVSPRRLVVSAYAPVISVAPDAPAWAVALAQGVAADLVTQLDRHRATDMVRITDRQIPTRPTNEGMDYATLTTGSVRLKPGEIGFVPVLRLSADRTLLGNSLVLDAELQLHDADGTVYRQPFWRKASLRDSVLLGRAAALTSRDRKAMERALTKDLRETFDRLLDQRSCEPITARLDISNGKLVVPVGRRHGLSRAALAFTADRDNTSELLEIVGLSGSSATLRPLDPGLSPQALAGRSVRFLEAAW